MPILTSIASRFRHAWGVITKGDKWLGQFNIVPIDGGSGKAAGLERPYAESVWVSRAIKKISGPIASVPIRFTVDGRNGDVEVKNDKLAAFWKQPARGLTYYDWIEATVGWLSLAGEAFWILGDEWLIPFPRGYDPFLVVRPDRMREILEDSTLVGWEYRDDDGRRHALLPAQVIQLKFWNPYNQHRGLAPWLAAKCASEADYLACNFNRNLWQNNGDRGPIIIGKNGIATDAQRQQIIDQLRSKRMAASRGDFRPIFLSGDITIEDPKTQSLDAAAIATRLQNRHEIALAFGVPPSMFDNVASYSIGSASDRYILIEETCMPIGEKIADHVEGLAQRMTQNDSVSAWFDWDEHSVMQQVRRERIDSAMKLWQMGKPMQAINDYLGLGMKPYEGWEVGFLPFSVAPVSQAMEPSLSGGFNFDEDSDDIKQIEEADETNPEKSNGQLAGARAIRDAFMVRESHEEGGEGDPEAEQFQAKRPRREISQWRSQMAKRAGLVRAYLNKFNRTLMDARAESLRNLDKITVVASGGNGTVKRAASTTIIFDLHKFTRALVTGMSQVNTRALMTSGQDVFDELDRSDPWKTPAGEVIEYNKIRQNKIVGAAEDVFKRINRSVEEGINKGDSIADISSAVKREFNDISRGRAKTIAMTETSTAYGRGRDLAMRDAGVKFKKWLTSGLGNVRDTHVEANGQVRQINEPFEVGGFDLMHPSDPTGPPEEVINCHCVSIAIESPDQ